MSRALSPRSWAVTALLVVVLLALVHEGGVRGQGPAGAGSVTRLPPECARFPDDSREPPDGGPVSEPWLRLGTFGYVANSPLEGVGPQGRFTLEMYVHTPDGTVPPSPRVAVTFCGPHATGVMAHAKSLTPRRPKAGGTAGSEDDGGTDSAEGGTAGSDEGGTAEERAKDGILLTVRLPASALRHGHSFPDLTQSDPPRSNDAKDYPVAVATLTSPDLDGPLVAASCDSHCDTVQGRAV